MVKGEVNITNTTNMYQYFKWGEGSIEILVVFVIGSIGSIFELGFCMARNKR